MPRSPRLNRDDQRKWCVMPNSFTNSEILEIFSSLKRYRLALILAYNQRPLSASKYQLLIASKYPLLVELIETDDVLTELLGELSTMEVRVLSFYVGDGQGLKQAEIAKHFKMSPKNASRHLANCWEKLNDSVYWLIKRPEMVLAIARSAYEEVNIRGLRFSTRTRRCLLRAKIENLSQLLDKNEDDLLWITNFGPTCLGEVKAKLHELGLNLRT